MRIFDFLSRLPSWGVHPDDHKRPAADRALRVVTLPEFLHLPLTQHVGGIARPVVRIGDTVHKGQLLARAHGNISAPVHAPTSGRIVAIGDVHSPHPAGLTLPGITLAADGDDRWDESLEGLGDPFNADPQQISEKVSAAGVVGMGGATFPAAVKLALGRRMKVQTLIINGGECEPYLSCDDRLMRERAADVVDGARLIAYAIGAREVRVGIENNKPEAIAAMRAAAEGFAEVHIVPVPARYPMGSDKQLISVLVKREVPAEGRAADAGVLVHNVGTAWAVHEAVRHGRPLVRRIVTVAGGAVRDPGNVETPLGVSVSHLIETCGGLLQAPARLVLGGPMMGTVLPSQQAPVVKGTSGVLALTAAEAGDQAPAPCIRCASCVDACPMGLVPHEMAAHIRAGALDQAADQWSLTDCIGCGCCAYVCPSRIPLTHHFDYAKGELAGRERMRLRQDATKRLTAERASRQEREAAEKAAAAAARKAAKAAEKAAAEKAKAEKAKAEQAAAEAAGSNEGATA